MPLNSEASIKLLFSHCLQSHWCATAANHPLGSSFGVLFRTVICMPMSSLQKKKKKNAPQLFSWRQLCLVCSRCLRRCHQKLKLNPHVEGAAEADLESDPEFTRKAEATLYSLWSAVLGFQCLEGHSAFTVPNSIPAADPADQGRFISADMGGCGQSYPLCCRIFSILSGSFASGPLYCENPQELTTT